MTLVFSSVVGGPMEPVSPAIGGGGSVAGVMSLPHQALPHTVPYGQDIHYQQCEWQKVWEESEDG